MKYIDAVIKKLDFELYQKIKDKKIIIVNDQSDISKINENIKIKISQPRNYEQHKYLFRVFEMAIENGIFEKMEAKGIINNGYYSVLYQKYKNDTEILLYLCKWFLLPLVEIITPDNKVRYDVQSISFEKKDNIEFIEFRAKCINFLSDILEIEINKIIIDKSI